MKRVNSHTDTSAFKVQRSTGVGQVSFRTRECRTVLDHLYQDGCAKVRLPKVHDESGPIAVLINTSGGLTGGDSLTFAVGVGQRATALATTQAQEKIYRSPGDDANVLTDLTADAGASLAWLPQETILFEGARLRRRIDVDLAEDARFLGLEALIFGRTARGERMVTGKVRESWRVRRAGRLLYADEMRLDDMPSAVLDQAASAAGQAAIATLVMVDSDLESRRDAVRALALGDTGASIVRDVLVIRMVAETGARLREKLTAVLNTLRNGAPLPKVWQC